MDYLAGVKDKKYNKAVYLSFTATQDWYYVTESKIMAEKFRSIKECLQAYKKFVDRFSRTVRVEDVYPIENFFIMKRLDNGNEER